MKYGRSTVHRAKTFWVLVLLIAMGCSAAAVYSGRAVANSQFQSEVSPISPEITPEITPSPTLTRPTAASQTPTRQAAPTSPATVFTPFPTLAPPTLFPSPLPTLASTLPPTTTATPTPISPAAVTATAVAKSFLPPPTLTSPGLLPPAPVAPAQMTPLSGPTLTPLPPHDDPATPRPTSSTPGIFQFLDNNLVVLGVAGICWSVLAIGAVAVAAVWVLRKRP